MGPAWSWIGTGFLSCFPMLWISCGSLVLSGSLLEWGMGWVAVTGQPHLRPISQSLTGKKGWLTGSLSWAPSPSLLRNSNCDAREDCWPQGSGVWWFSGGGEKDAGALRVAGSHPAHCPCPLQGPQWWQDLWWSIRSSEKVDMPAF